jgi:sulfotransferase family protein
LIRHLLLIGAQRSGTTYLHTLLDAHPQIAMARPTRPEPKVFCDPVASAKGLDWYHDHYFRHADDEQLLGDKSTSYLEDPAAPARARDMLGEAHILAILRDPVKRAVSNWRFSTENGLESRPMETALLENLTQESAWDPTATSVSPFAYLERGRYIDYLEPWMDTFPDSMHVLFLRELVEDDATAAMLWKALGVGPANTADRPTAPVNSIDGEPPTLSGELLGRLESYFESSNRALSARLGRSLPW